MLLDYSKKGKIKIDMKRYVEDMIEAFPEILSNKIKCPWTTRLFNNSKDSKESQQHKNHFKLHTQTHWVV